MKNISLIGLLLTASVWPVANACGDVITYIVDPTQSSLTISGTFQGYPLQFQPNASVGLRTSYAGTVTASRDFNAGTLQITSSAITAQTSGSSYLPPGIMDSLRHHLGAVWTERLIGVRFLTSASQCQVRL